LSPERNEILTEITKAMGASKREGLYNIRTSYPHYRSRAGKDRIPPRDYFIIIGLFMRYIVKLIFEGHIVKLPELGSMGLKGRKLKPYIDKDGKIKGTYVNHGATAKYRRENPGSDMIIYYSNEDTAGVCYTIHWSQKKMYAENKELYSFELSREHKRASVGLIRSHSIEFDIE